MPNTASLKFTEIDLSFSPADIPLGVSGVLVETQRGPVGRTDLLINSWNQFMRYYGGLIPGNDGPLLCKRALESGSQLRVQRVLHYTDPALANTLTATVATTADVIANAAIEELFKLQPIAPGSAYNNLKIQIGPASNGQTGYFNITAWIEGDDSTVENYANIRIPINQVGLPGIQNWLSSIQLTSYLIKPVYVDLTGIVDLMPVVTPTPMVVDFTTGSDGGVIVDTDYVGDSAGKTGFYAFDGIDDIITISAPNKSSATIHVGGTAYVENRKDMVYFAHLDNSLTTENALVAAKTAMNIDSSYVAFFAGGIVIADPLTGVNKNISEMGDVLGIAANAAEQNGAYRSFAGAQRGLIQNALGIVNNFGYTGNYNGMNLLANNMINTVIAREGRLMIWGNFTAQLDNSLLSFLNIRRLVIYLKKVLTPVVSRYIEEPNTPNTWKKIHMAVDPLFRELVDKQALYSWDWQGDQNAKADLSDLVINNVNDVSNGKYLVKAFIAPVPSLQEMEIQIIITQSGISFEEVINLTTN